MRTSKKTIRGKEYHYEYNRMEADGKRKHAANRTSDNICVSCGRRYLNSKQSRWLEVGILTGKTFNSANPEQGGWTFLDENLNVVKEGKECECGLCGKVKETFNYRTFNYLGLGDAKPDKK